MSNTSKQLSNPFSTGGGGGHFEAHIQASFVTLMLTGGFAPCLPCWPIREIKLQGKIDGFDTDDLIVFVEDPSNKQKRKLLGQIKHTIHITPGNLTFGEVMQAAWNDFNNPAFFSKNKDVIALITGYSVNLMQADKNASRKRWPSLNLCPDAGLMIAKRKWSGWVRPVPFASYTTPIRSTLVSGEKWWRFEPMSSTYKSGMDKDK